MQYIVNWGQLTSNYMFFIVNTLNIIVKIVFDNKIIVKFAGNSRASD